MALLNVNMYSCSHIGNSRDNHEDNFLLCRGNYLSPDEREAMAVSRVPHCVKTKADISHFLVAVSDGMGGHSCGEVASLHTVREMSIKYEEMITAASIGEKDFGEQIAKLNREVYALGQSSSDTRGMGATLCGVVANNSDVYGFNVGDSRMYWLADGKLTQLSTDHTEGERLLSLGLLSKEEVERHPRRKNIYKYIGYSGELVPDVYRIPTVKSGTAILLCSDGLCDVLTDSEIEQALNSSIDIEAKGNQLISMALGRNIGHGDNITVILIEF